MTMKTTTTKTTTRQKPEREFNIGTSGQFRTLAMFYLYLKKISQPSWIGYLKAGKLYKTAQCEVIFVILWSSVNHIILDNQWKQISIVPLSSSAYLLQPHPHHHVIIIMCEIRNVLAHPLLHHTRVREVGVPPPNSNTLRTGYQKNVQFSCKVFVLSQNFWKSMTLVVVLGYKFKKYTAQY